MSLLGYILLLTAALCCTAAPAPDGSCLKPERREAEELTGDWEEDSYPPGKTATYQCRPGYSRLGTIKMVCLDGKWQDLGRRGQCRSSCLKPERREAEELTGDWEEDSYPPGTTATYQCRPGYSPLGTIKMVCLDGKWQDLGRRGQCRKRSCGHPGDIPFGSFYLKEGDSFVFGAIVEYSCEDGYQMVSKEKTRQCTANGWSNYPPHCEVRNCPPVEAAANVNVLSTSYDEEYSVGQVVRFECKDPNLMLEGASEIFCTSEGGWNLEPPKCVEIRCRPPTIDNGKVNDPKDGVYNNNDVIQITCSEGFRPSTSRDIKCTKDGWTPNPSCEEILCSAYSTVTNGKLVAVKPSYKFEEEIEVKCDDGYVLQTEPTKLRKCTSNGWSPPPVCVSKKCGTHAIEHGYMYYRNYHYTANLGSFLYYYCDTNYLSHEKYHYGNIRCTNFGWDPEPKCSRQCLSSKASFENAALKDRQNTYLEGEKVQFQCKYNYYTQDGKTNGERTCLPNGEFTPAKCSKTCKAPKLPEGIFKPTKTAFYIGEYLQYECNQGFMTENRKLSSSAWCLEEGWSEEPRCISVTCSQNGVSYKDGDVVKYKCPSWQRPKSELGQCYYFGLHPPLKCLDIKCTIPDTPNLIISPHRSSYPIGRKVSFSCEDGFGRVGSLESVCEEGGWNPPLPTCKTITCTIPDTPNLIICPHRSSYPIGKKVLFSCEDGFGRVGSLESVCEEEGWNPSLPTCKEIKCTIPDNANLIRKPAKVQYKKNNRVSLDCEEGFVIEGTDITTCTANGWKPPLPTCVISPNSNLVTSPPDVKDETETRKKCPQPYNPENAEIKDPKEEYYDNDNVTMTCVRRYKMQGSPVIQCIKGKWEQPPECIQLTPCKNLPRIHNGDITESSKQETYITGDIVTFTCKLGFHLTGPEESTCVNGQWTALPTCTERPCDAPPDISHEAVVEKKESYNHGENFKYECENGFRLSGKDAASCTKGRWMNIPTCVATSCTAPDYVQNSKIDGQIKNNYASGEKVTYVCNPGFALERSLTGEAVCEDTHWKNVPVCRKPCTAKEKDMEDNNIRLKWNLDPKLYTTHGDTMEFVCLDEYEAPQGTQMRITCDQGKLEYPKCIKKGFCVLDQSEMIAHNIHYNVSSTVDHGQTITFQCDEGMMPENNLKAKCERKRISYPKCTASRIGVQCGPPPVVQYGDTISFNKPFYKSGESVEYKCPEYYILKGNRIVRCLNGVWDEAPICLEPCTTKEKDMKDNNIRLKWTRDTKLYSSHGDLVEFVCLDEYEAPQGTQMRITCDQGKLEYPKCIKKESCTTPEIKNGFLKTEVQHSYDSGSYVQFECNKDYVINVPINVKCENGKWTELPVCYSPCKISIEDLTKRNIQLLPSDNNPEITHRHGTRFSVSCKSGFKRPNQAALAIECSNGEFRYPRCFAGKTCRIDQDELDKNNLELDEVHDNEVYYEEKETVHFKCKTGYYHISKPTGICSGETLAYPSCTAQSSV